MLPAGLDDVCYVGSDGVVDIDLPDEACDLLDRLVIDHWLDRKSTRLNSSHVASSYAVFCLKKKNELANLSRKTKRFSMGFTKPCGKICASRSWTPNNRQLVTN